MRLLIADKLHPSAVEELRALPLDVDYEPDITRESLIERLPGAGILVVRSTEVTESALDKARQLHLIIRAGAEHSTIDVKAASLRGIQVANCPGKNAGAVAELVFGLMISLDRRIPDAVQSLRQGRWTREEFGKAEGLAGKRLGIAGMGAIGREVASRARAFGLEVSAYSRSLTPSRAAEWGVSFTRSLDELAASCDILSLHMASNPRTRQSVGEAVFAKLRPGAMFINTARADLVDYSAMKKAVVERGLRAGIDVYPDEPKGLRHFETDLFSTVGDRGGFIYGTPHIAASTDQAQKAIANETVRVIRSFLLEGTVPNVVNVSDSVARFQVIIRMVDKVGTFANVLGVIKLHGINIEEVTNTVFDGGQASCAKLRVQSRPSEACLSEIRAFEEVLQVDVITLPNLA